MIEKLIIHVGTHRTGTTALQHYMHEHRDAHAALGVFYPPTDQGRTYHKALTKPLMRENAAYMLELIAAAVAAAPENTRTLFFSHSAIYRNWSSFSITGREVLRAVAQHYPLEIWASFRDPLGFILSLYLGRIRNAPRNPPPPTLESMLDDPDVVASLDYRRFAKSINKLIAPRRLCVRPYSTNVIASTMAQLGLPFDGVERRDNQSISDAIIRQRAHLDALPLHIAIYAEARRALVESADLAIRHYIPSEAVAAAVNAHIEHQGQLRAIDGRTLAECWAVTAPGPGGRLTPAASLYSSGATGPNNG